MTTSRFRYLFERYYSQEATTEETREFMRMLEASGHDEALKAEIARVLDEAGMEEAGMPEKNADAILHSIMEKRPPRMMRARTWAAIAASLLLVMGIAGLLRMGTKKPVVKNAPAQTTIVPGKDRAILVLDNGEEIDLEKAGNGAIGVQQGLQAQIKGDELLYDSTKTASPTYNTIKTPRGGQYRVVLPDGSKVWLNAASSVRFPTVFNETERTISITGEVYLEVAHNAARPFLVNVEDMTVQVTGTRFNIMAYEDEKAIQTTLLQGGVNVRYGEEKKRLEPGLQASLSRASKKFNVAPANTEQVTAWKEGRFEFEGNIKGIMRQIARWYDVEIEYKGNLDNKNFAVAISRSENIHEVLKVLELTGSIHFETDDNTVTVIP